MSQPPNSAVPKRFVLVACEASGDLLGAGLVAALRQRYPNARIEGIGGELMQNAGMELWEHYSEISVMGIVEVLKHLPRLLKMRKKTLTRTIEVNPDVFIGIDGPDFNLGLERKLKQRGIKTIHYVSPSIWAWREGRAKTIKRSADLVLCLFPMEPPIYAKYDMPAKFIGHPMADTFEMTPDQGAARAALGLEAIGRQMAVLPGSRLGEIARLGGVFMEAAARVRRKHPDVSVVTPMANSACRDAFQKLIDTLPAAGEGQADAVTEREWAELRSRTSMVDGRAHEVMKAADVLLLASGTAALEGMLAKRPMVVAYKIAPLTHFIVKKLGILKINRYSLPNILAGEPIVKELMQDDCTAEAIAAEMCRLLEDGTAQSQIVPRFTQLHEMLRGGGSQAAADAVAALAER